LQYFGLDWVSTSSRFQGIYGVRSLGGDWIGTLGGRAEVLGETGGLSLDFRALSVLESALPEPVGGETPEAPPVLCTTELERVPARGSTRRGGAGTLPVGWVVQGDELFVVGEVWERAPARAGARHLVGGQNRRVPSSTGV
jgi:hypothetical protein